MQRYVIQYLPFAIVLFIYCSCAWWSAETTIETRLESGMTGSILNIIESELQLGGHSIHTRKDRKSVIVTEWLGPHVNQKRRNIPVKAYRYKLRFQPLNQCQQIVVSVRYQEFHRGNRTTTIGWGERNNPVPGRSGWYTINYDTPNFNPNYWGDGGGANWGAGDSYFSGEEQYDFESALWDDRQPDWIIDQIEDLLYRVIRRIGADSELSWVLVKPPELSGPKYLGPLPRKKN